MIRDATIYSCHFHLLSVRYPEVGDLQLVWEIYLTCLFGFDVFKVKKKKVGSSNFFSSIYVRGFCDYSITIAMLFLY